MTRYQLLSMALIGLSVAGIFVIFWPSRTTTPSFRHTQSAADNTSKNNPISPSSTPIIPAQTPLSTNTTSAPHTDFYRALSERKARNRNAIGIHFFGDMMLDRSVARAMGASGTAYLFEHISGENNLLDPRIDLTITNLEGPFAPARVKTSKSIAFRFDPRYARELARIGFDAVSLANNHTLDMGWDNVTFTHQTLRNAGLGFFGDQLREAKEFTYVTTTAGTSIALVGLNNTDHILNLKRIAAVLEDAATRASTTIVMMHWGDEYKRISNNNQRTFARFLIDNGVAAVIGAHPHVIQEVELYKGKPIFYSLGNFVFDQYFSPETQEGLSVGLILEEGNITSVYALPFYGIKSKIFPMDEQRRDVFYDWLNTNSRLGDKKFDNGKIDF